MSVSWEVQCHALYEDIKKQTLIINEQQEEINRLTIAYQNASDQRQHYVEKCLKLSEVVLDLVIYLEFYGVYNNSEVAKTALDKYKDLIDELEHNLKDKK